MISKKTDAASGRRLRIHVTGNAGAGKTTLAKALGREFDLPVYHLDSVVWNSNWLKVPIETRELQISKLTASQDWIIEGVSDQVRAQADLVLYLDTPRYKCMYRCIKRCLVVGFNTRPELPPSCPEIAILFRAIMIAWRFPVVVGQKLFQESGRSNFYVCRDAAHAKVQLRQFLSTR